MCTECTAQYFHTVLTTFQQFPVLYELHPTVPVHQSCLAICHSLHSTLTPATAVHHTNTHTHTKWPLQHVSTLKRPSSVSTIDRQQQRGSTKWIVSCKIQPVCTAYRVTCCCYVTERTVTCCCYVTERTVTCCCYVTERTVTCCCYVTERTMLLKWRWCSSLLDTATQDHGFEQDTVCCRQPTSGQRLTCAFWTQTERCLEGTEKDWKICISNDSHFHKNIIQQLRHRLTVGRNRWWCSCREQLSERRKILAARRPRATDISVRRNVSVFKSNNFGILHCRQKHNAFSKHSCLPVETADDLALLREAQII